MTPEQKLEIRQQEEDLRAVLATPQGERVLWRILSKTAPFQPTFARSDRESAFAEGRRNLGLWLIGELQRVGPDVFPGMLLRHAEAVSLSATNQAEADKDSEHA
jgi:hypothetical protein